MRTETTHTDGSLNNLLLPATILMANIDMTGLFEYALKALIGGAIWLAFKLGGEYLHRRSVKKRSVAGSSRNRHRKTRRENGNIE